MKNVLIVESPAKAKTISKILASTGDSWDVLATGGHIVDLPKNKLGVDQHADGGYTAHWRLIAEKGKLLKSMREKCDRADMVFVGADDDREGERIASDVISRLALRDPIRITFTEITRDAILNAISSGSRPVSESTVDAQIARRLIDRVVGYPVSSIISWCFRKDRSRHKPQGVGRVISPALHLLVEAERAIQQFTPSTYQKCYIDYVINGIQVRLVGPEKFTEETASELQAMLGHLNANDHLVYSYKRKINERLPFPPFVTTRLYRAAFYLFGKSPEETAKIAQSLYEGIDIGEERVGLITYPRTDSHTISMDALIEIMTLLAETYQDEPRYCINAPREYPNKDSAQAAHEAIRPTHFSKKFFPRNLKKYLTDDQYNLYKMIWCRTLSTQMGASIYDVSKLTVDIGGNKFSVNAHERLFDGWEQLDGATSNAAEINEEDEFKNREVIVPECSIGDHLNPIDIGSVDIATRAPSRYGVGRFMTVLDHKGIARPSTIAGIVPSLKRKGYIEVHAGMLVATDTGQAVDDWTTEHCEWLNDTDRAASFERDLDEVASNEKQRDSLVLEYGALVENLKKTVGYTNISERTPSPGQISYMESIAKERGIEVPEGARMDSLQASKFIEENKIERACLGKCPKCKEQVLAYPTRIQCSSTSCNFSLSLRSLKGMIENFNLDAPDEITLAQELLKRRKTFCGNLPGKNGKAFSAYLGIKKDSRWGWQPSIVGFPKPNNDQIPVFVGHPKQ